MPASIIFNQTTQPAGVAGVAREDFDVGLGVTCSNATVETSYLWTLVDVPIRSALVRGTTGTLSTFGFIPDVKGTYLVSLKVNGSALVTDNAESFCAVLSFGDTTLGWRYPAAGEERNLDNQIKPGLGFPGDENVRGWATEHDLQLEEIEAAVYGVINAVVVSPGPGTADLVKLDLATGTLDASVIPVLGGAHPLQGGYNAGPDIATTTALGPVPLTNGDATAGSLLTLDHSGNSADPVMSIAATGAARTGALLKIVDAVGVTGIEVETALPGPVATLRIDGYGIASDYDIKIQPDDASSGEGRQVRLFASAGAAGEDGGEIRIIAGDGGVDDGSGGDGGNIVITAGWGGDDNTTNNAGVGGSITITASPGGGDGGGGDGGTGGFIQFAAGQGGGSAGTGGNFLVSSGMGASAVSQNGESGNLVLGAPCESGKLPVEGQGNVVIYAGGTNLLPEGEPTYQGQGRISIRSHESDVVIQAEKADLDAIILNASDASGGVKLQVDSSDVVAATADGVLVTGDFQVAINSGNAILMEAERVGSPAIIMNATHASGSGTLAFQINDTERLRVLGSGISVTGNVAVTGTVDGRDVATDGTKLDTLSARPTIEEETTTTRTTDDADNNKSIYYTNASDITVTVNSGTAGTTSKHTQDNTGQVLLVAGTATLHYDSTTFALATRTETAFMVLEWKTATDVYVSGDMELL